MQASSEGFGAGINYHQITACWQKHEVLRARIPISSDAKLAGGGQIPLCRPNSWEDKGTTLVDGAVKGGVIFASDVLNPCLSRVERTRSAVGRRRLGLLCWASNFFMCWWKVGQIVFASEAESSGSHDGIQLTLSGSSLEFVSMLSLSSLLRPAQAGQAQGGPEFIGSRPPG
eukprot:1140059-Pelagomonas_calceolata.AAC.3